MKKYISLLLCALLVCTILPLTTVFAASKTKVEVMVPNKYYSIDSGKTVSLPDEPGTVYTTAQLNMYSDSTLIIPEGVTLKFENYPHYKQRLNIIGDNVTIHVFGRLEAIPTADNVRIEGAEFGSNFRVLVYEGASINVTYPMYGSYESRLYKTLPAPESIFSGVNDTVVLHFYSGQHYSSYTVQITSSHNWENGVCTGCGMTQDAATASVLSEGSLTIVCTVAAAAVVALGAVVIVKKKRVKS